VNYQFLNDCLKIFVKSSGSGLWKGRCEVHQPPTNPGISFFHSWDCHYRSPNTWTNVTCNQNRFWHHLRPPFACVRGCTNSIH